MKNMGKNKKKVAFDTNILIFATNQKSPYFDYCNQLFREVDQGKYELYLADKTLYEFFAVLSNVFFKEKREGVKEVFDFYLNSTNYTLMHSTNQTAHIVSELLSDQETAKGGYIHDIVLAAMLLENGVDVLYTDNKKDFQPFTWLKKMKPVL